MAKECKGLTMVINGVEINNVNMAFCETHTHMKKEKGAAHARTITGPALCKGTRTGGP